MGAQGAGHLGPYPGPVCLDWVLTMGLGTWSRPESKCSACFIYDRADLRLSDRKPKWPDPTHLK